MISSGRGVQFTTSRWFSWCKQVGANHITTTAFHPQSNGMVERFHRQLKAALRACGDPSSWEEQLPWALLRLRAAPKDELGISSGQAALGLQLAIPGQLLAQPVGHPSSQHAIPAAKRSFAKVVVGPTPQDTADIVYVLCGSQGGPLADSYDGPFQVVDRGQKVFRLQLGARVDTVSRDRLKAHLGVVDLEVVSPRPRGRPLGTGVGGVTLQAGPSE